MLDGSSKERSAHTLPQRAYDLLVPELGEEACMELSEIITDESVDFVRQADGRWRWHARTAEAAHLLGIAVDAPSLLSFKSAMEAAADVAVHADAPRDATGPI